MKFRISEPILFFSVDKSYRTQEENKPYRTRIERVLTSLEIAFDKGIVNFNGNLEVSYKISYNKFYLIKWIIFEINNQDSVVEVRRNNQVFLHTSGGVIKSVGILKNVPQYKAQQVGNYSIFDNTFFIVD